MAFKTVTPDELKALVGTSLGTSDWITLDQQRINNFADCTEDHQFIHIDQEAAAKTPFGGTIAHGFLTLSMLVKLCESVAVHPEGLVMGVNYGLNKVRFLAPVPAGGRVRAHVELASVEQKDANRFLTQQNITVEIEGVDTPALYAEWLGMSFIALSISTSLEKIMTIRYDGKVAIVTGAGGGLGRSHAIELAKRGAKVVVNDLGGSVSGEGQNSDAALAVVAEIEALGGEAIAHPANVAVMEDVEDMVAKTMDAWGRIDILVNNAGILRDKSFIKMDMADFKLVLDVHLMGSVNCTKAVWEIMKNQEYGRIVMTSSSSGLYGNFGQSNYGAAKLGVVGFMNTLAQEGAKYNIRVNALAPTAGTRMTEGLMSEQAFNLLTPETVTPAVLYLVNEDAPTHTILAAGAGAYAVAKIVETDAVWLPIEEQTPEGIAAHWDQISGGAETQLKAGFEQTFRMVGKAAEGLGIKLEG